MHQWEAKLWTVYVWAYVGVFVCICTCMVYLSLLLVRFPANILCISNKYTKQVSLLHSQIQYLWIWLSIGSRPAVLNKPIPSKHIRRFPLVMHGCPGPSRHKIEHRSSCIRRSCTHWPQVSLSPVFSISGSLGNRTSIYAKFQLYKSKLIMTGLAFGFSSQTIEPSLIWCSPKLSLLTLHT